MRDHLGVFNVSSDLQFARGILLLDDFEGTLNWKILGSNANHSGDVHADAAFMDSQGLKLDTGATATADGDYVMAVKGIGWPSNDLLVMRFRVALEQIADCEMVSIFPEAKDGSDQMHARVDWHPGDGTVEYLDSAGSMQSLGTYGWTIDADTFVEMELVLDLATHQYISFALNGEETDMAGIAYQDVGDDTDRLLLMRIYVECTAAGNAVAYVDSFYAGQFLYI